MDDATLLVLPSWPEGLGRVIIEAFARGRGVVATEAGGIPDLVTHEREGLLIPPADVTALAEALERVLTDRELAARLGAAARERYVDWHSTPEELAARAARARRGDRRGHRPLMRLLFVTQTIDADHPALAQTIDLVRALAGRFETVDVLCDSVGRHDLPPNVELLDLRRELPRRAWPRASRERLAASSRAAPTPCSSTWCRSSSSCCAPLAKPRRVPARCSGTRTGTPSRSLRARARASPTSSSASTARSFPLETPKLHATGHAIDVERFTPGGAHRAGRAACGCSRSAGWRAGRATTTMLAALAPGGRGGPRRASSSSAGPR